MIKADWQIFQAKFSENPQFNFEWFCYLLICKEFNKPNGIFRYKNQAGIETDPIETNNEIIGWQAKYYTTTLSNHKDELISTLEKSKEYYPKISKIIFYSNQEWVQSKGRRPKGLIELEKKAKDLELELDWRTTGFFESEVVCNENKILAEYFFSLQNSTLDLIEEQKQHTESILNSIQSLISFNSKNLEIDRTAQLENLKNSTESIKILSGEGGVGKTALIKKLYEDLKNGTPFFIFKATEFELRSINDLFPSYNFYNFIELTKSKDLKTIVIDSAEKLLDLDNTDPFKEFLSILIENNWQIIFTTRNHYLEDLNYQFFEIYNIAPLNIKISILKDEELNLLSEESSFSLPKDEKLFNFIKNPFYLNEYLKLYDEHNELNYNEFKSNLWTKNIKKSKPERETCFLQTALERANSGQFFITPKCDKSILNDELLKDDILGYEDAGYFITHDIYEEWALEKIIENSFINKADEEDFFLKIGQSLPIRRSFRSWLSEKLLLENNDIKSFIESIIDNKSIDSFWKDEILVSILFSDYSKTFFDLFKDTLLENKQELLKRVTFILRIACKEIDDNLFNPIGTKNLNIFSLKYILTRPKGKGWETLIEFVFNNIETIGIENINFILPIVHDWNSKTKQGKTTKYSTLIALQFYQWTINDDVYFSSDDSKEKLLQTILYGSSEIEDELKTIFDDILENKWKNHNDPYHELSEMILTKIEGISFIKVFPKYVFKLARLFWIYTPNETDYKYGRSSLDVDQYFGLESNHSEYHPASAFQTPIYWLLQTSLKETIDFILDFNNEAIEVYANSGFDDYVEEVDVYIDNNIQKQYMSNCLWGMYRGMGSPVSPYLLQSIHMALEKFFLENAEHVNSEILESWLHYLLKNSTSASITSVVTSIVLAYPDKTFNIAKILFKTKEFILYDTARLVSEDGAESFYSIGKNMGTNSNEFFDNERIGTCDDNHRKLSLENIFLNYQCFRTKQISEEESEKRQKELWEILDNYYEELKKETDLEDNKTWRLYLARIDKRKMNITTEDTDEGFVIQFNPELEPDLKEYSEKSIANSSEPFKYTSLKLWADYKYKNDEKYKQYKQYEDNPNQVLKEVKEIIQKLNNQDRTFGENFNLFNYAIPPYVCSVLLRDYIKDLDKEEKEFCKVIVLERASSSLQSSYQYQISDGVQQAFSVLPILLNEFPIEKENIKAILFIGLFQEDRVGGMLDNHSFSIFSTIAINHLWESNFDDAHSLLLGYLQLKPIYNKIFDMVREENFRKNHYNYDTNQILEKFIEENEKSLKNIVDCKLKLSNIKNIENLDIEILNTAFQVIPKKTNNEDHKKISKIIISTFATKILSEDSDEKIDYTIKHNFLEKYAYFVLSSPKSEITNYIQPFIENLNQSEATADLLKEFVIAEDFLNSYENFWYVWNIFKEWIFVSSKDGNTYWRLDKILRTYLFAEVPWKETSKDWRSFKDKNKRFFKEVTEKIGHCPSVLYSISKLLNDIGTPFLDDGVIWISNILDKNKDYINKNLETNTIYYLEHLVRKFIFNNREKIKKDKMLKNKIIIILNFLIEKGSVVGYMLRESII